MFSALFLFHIIQSEDLVLTGFWFTCINPQTRKKSEPLSIFLFFDSTRIVRSIVHSEISTEHTKNFVRLNFFLAKDLFVMMIYNLLRFLFVELSFVRYGFHIYKKYNRWFRWKIWYIGENRFNDIFRVMFSACFLRRILARWRTPRRKQQPGQRFARHSHRSHY